MADGDDTPAGQGGRSGEEAPEAAGPLTGLWQGGRGVGGGDVRVVDRACDSVTVHCCGVSAGDLDCALGHWMEKSEVCPWAVRVACERVSV